MPVYTDTDIKREELDSRLRRLEAELSEARAELKTLRRKVKRLARSNEEVGLVVAALVELMRREGFLE